MADVAHLGRPLPGPAGHVLAHAVRAEDPAAVAAVVLAAGAAAGAAHERVAAALANADVVLVLPADLQL